MARDCKGGSPVKVILLPAKNLDRTELARIFREIKEGGKDAQSSDGAANDSSRD